MKADLSQTAIRELEPVLAQAYAEDLRPVLFENLTTTVRVGLPRNKYPPLPQAIQDLPKLNKMSPIDGSRPMITFLDQLAQVTRTDAEAHSVIVRHLNQLRAKYAQHDAEVAWGGWLQGELTADAETQPLVALGLAESSSPWADGTLHEWRRIGEYLAKHPREQQRSQKHTLGQLGLVPPNSARAALPLEGMRGIYSWVGPDFLTRGLETCALVARVYVDAFAKNWGTAWMITPELAVTCYHVLAEAKHIDSSGVSQEEMGDLAGRVHLHFANEPPSDGREKPDVKGTSLAVAYYGSPVLDFAILRLAEPREGCLTVSRQPFELSRIDAYIPANIPQYPHGGSLKAGIRRNHITRTTPWHAWYDTDTNVGSSGSPVCDDHWQVKALHRADGNWGVHLSAILSWIDENQPAVMNEIKSKGKLAD